MGSRHTRTLFFYPRAIPQYNVGYGAFKERMDDAEKEASGLFLGGHFRDGISLGDSILAGYNAADRIVKHLETSNSE